MRSPCAGLSPSLTHLSHRPLSVAACDNSGEVEGGGGGGGGGVTLATKVVAGVFLLFLFLTLSCLLRVSGG